MTPVSATRLSRRADTSLPDRTLLVARAPGGRWIGAGPRVKILARLLASAAVLATATPALAQTAHGSATWSPVPASGDWNTGGNWVPATVPNGIADTATFGPSTTTAVTLSQNTTVNGITFNATAVNPYTITAAADRTLVISGPGIVNNSGVTQTLVAAGASSIGLFSGKISFTGSASAGTASNTNLISQAATSQGGVISFSNNSNAGSASLTASGGTNSANIAGRIQFFDNASAGNAKLLVSAGSSAATNGAIEGGAIQFFGTSTAGNSTITVAGDGLNDINNDSNEGFLVFGENATAGSSMLVGTGGRVQLTDSASAGNATIQLTGGGIDFYSTASGGTARVILNGTATLDISATTTSTPGAVSVGSIEGAGFVRLGESALTVGTNNISTTFAGSITERGRQYDLLGGIYAPTAASGNALLKTGTGTLTLSGASIYTGPTTVNAGTLSVTGSLASPVTVSGGAKLTNSGTIGGLTLASGGTLASTGTPTTMTVAGPVSFASGSTVTFDITSAGMSDLLATSGIASLGGATLNILAMPGTYTGTSYTLLTATGGLTGMFNFGGITGGTFATQPTLSYTADSVLLNFAALAVSTHGSATWKLGPASGDWDTAANWVSGVVPNGSADTATFDKTSIPGVSLSQNTEVNGIVFNPGASANPYTITAAAGTTLTISGTGIVNNTAIQQNLIAAAATGTTAGQGGIFTFLNNSSAGSSNFTVVGNGVYSGRIQFLGSSDAGSSTIHTTTPGSTVLDAVIFGNSSSAANAHIVIDGAAVGSSGTTVGFNGTSTAANAVISVAGDGLNNRNTELNEGFLTFTERSTAGNATITSTGGRVQFFDTASAGTATITANAGGIDFGSQTDGSRARIVLNGTAVLDISDVYLALNGSIRSGAIAIGSVEGAGFIRLGQNALTVGNSNRSTVFSGSITEGGGAYDSIDTRNNFTLTSGNAFLKAGTGTLTLSGPSTYTGPTMVNAGTLSVTGSLVSPVTVNTGGTLTVSGTTGALAVAGGGKVQGSGGGQLSVNGGIGFAAGSTYALGITAAGQADRISGSGTASLNGGAVQVTGAPSFLTAIPVRKIVPDANGRTGTLQLSSTSSSARYTILSAAGGVTGTFAAVTASATTATPLLSYDATNVYLTLVGPSVMGQSLALTPNELAAGVAFLAQPASATIPTALSALGLAAEVQAFDALSGEVHATVRSALFDDGALLREATFDRLQGAAAGDNAREGVALWADVRGARLTLDSDGNAARARSDGQATVIGADFGRGAWRLGAAYAHNWGRVTVADRNSSAKWDGDSVTAYAGGAVGPVALKSGASETWYHLHTLRSPTLLGAGAATDGGQYRARLEQVFGEAAIGARVGGVHGEVFGRYTGERLTTDAFAETGDATALSGPRHRNELGWSLAGARGVAPIGRAVSFSLSAGWTHLFGQAAPSALLADSSGTGFLVLGAPLARDGARVAAALSARVGDRLMLRVGYSGDYARGNTQHALNAAAVVRF